MTVWVGKGESGSLQPATSATVSVFDHGFTVADGIFETMKVVDGRVFLWPWHLDRLHVSAALLGLDLPADDHLTDVVRQVARANPDAGRLRLTVTAGDGPLGSDRSGSPVSVVAAASSTKPWPPTAQLAIAQWPRNERSPLVGAKTTSYAENVLALEYAHQQHASEAIFFNTEGVLTEGTGSNIFIVRDGVVMTPPTSDGLLAGITRRFVLALADDAIHIREASITRDALRDADEVFISSSTRDIQPVDRIAEQAYAVGPVTLALQERFRTEAARPDCWL